MAVLMTYRLNCFYKRRRVVFQDDRITVGCCLICVDNEVFDVRVTRILTFSPSLQTFGFCAFNRKILCKTFTNENADLLGHTHAQHSIHIAAVSTYIKYDAGLVKPPCPRCSVSRE